MLARNRDTIDSLSPAFAEELADILFEIGKDQFKTGNHTDAMYWLDKAYELLAGHDLVSRLLSPSVLFDRFFGVLKRSDTGHEKRAAVVQLGLRSCEIQITPEDAKPVLTFAVGTYER